MEISEEKLKALIKYAFKRGENWGVTYSTWFTPSESDTNEHIENTVEYALNCLNL